MPDPFTVPRRTYGFTVAGGTLDRQTDIAIYLDGQDVTSQCQCADDQLGFVVLYTEPDRSQGIRSLHFGEVRIFACEKE